LRQPWKASSDQAFKHFCTPRALFKAFGHPTLRFLTRPQWLRQSLHREGPSLCRFGSEFFFIFQALPEWRRAYSLLNLALAKKRKGEQPLLSLHYNLHRAYP